MALTTFSDSEDVEWMNDVPLWMLMNGQQQPGPSHAPPGFEYVESNETQSCSDSETDVECMNNVPMSF
ncbi:hypothetical protein AVEN_56919-1 [Araneus ventricosus]|uniref:Uncharacterized protein n=1 Tax=Araneus ventricosus TaxID=182803 RepID=A0A4Y2EUG9_ARAVE|nr:hypothetical protein AVEN_56919-1 [Araneus ventricosus]